MACCNFLNMAHVNIHMCTHTPHTISQDLIIFPGDAEFLKVPQCTTGRVFLLKFKDSSSRRFFYWMQEPSSSKDEEITKKVR